MAKTTQEAVAVDQPTLSNIVSKLLRKLTPEANELLAAARTTTVITNDDELDEVADLQVRIKKVNKAFSDALKSVTDPLEAAKKFVRSQFSLVTTPLEEQGSRLSALNHDYRRKKEEEDARKLLKAQEKAHSEGKPFNPLTVATASPAQKVVTEAGSLTSAKQWYAEIQDKRRLLEFAIKQDDTHPVWNAIEIKTTTLNVEARRLKQEGEVYPGVRFFEDFADRVRT